jgi:hypothetical protein
MKDPVKKFLDNLAVELKPIVEQATKYYSFDEKAAIRKDGALQLFNRPWVAPENYGLLLFPPASNELIDKCERRSKLKFPDAYRKILAVMNGCFIYDLALYGLPETLYSTGLLDRSTLNQFDLGIANKFWKYQYETDTDRLIHIGGRAYSSDERIGYFMNSDNRILSLRKNGEQLNTWTDFRDFLSDEIIVSEKMMTGKMPK